MKCFANTLSVPQLTDDVLLTLQAFIVKIDKAVLVIGKE